MLHFWKNKYCIFYFKKSITSIKNRNILLFCFITLSKFQFKDFKNMSFWSLDTFYRFSLLKFNQTKVFRVVLYLFGDIITEVKSHESWFPDFRVLIFFPLDNISECMSLSEKVLGCNNTFMWGSLHLIC